LNLYKVKNWFQNLRSNACNLRRYSEEYAVGTLRLSVGRHTTQADVEKGAR
jgi:cysteine sulfinate desulfinase/cysteine desulfurase-like protein